MDDLHEHKRQRTELPSLSSINNLPRIILHRFNRDIRTQRKNKKYFDVVTRIRNCTDFIYAQENTKYGASFFQVTSSDDISKKVHGNWNCPCFVTASGSELDARFDMKHTGSFDCTLELIIGGNTVKEKRKIGEHYSLVPSVDMSLEEYVTECNRIMALSCQIQAGGPSTELSTWPPENQWPPGDRVMCCVVDALYHYAHIHAVDPSLSILAGLYYCSLGDSSMTLEDILHGNDHRLIGLIYEA